MDPNAVSDILMSEEFAGCVDAVKDITGVIDGGFSFFISVIAFFIISVALLRNVLAGCYVAFPKFWDTVHTAHTKRDENKAFFETIKGLKDSYKNVSMSTLKLAIFGIIPDIKELTEFEGDAVKPKEYFIKAIPEMIMVVIIGVFIYNGYYRDVTAKVSDVGSELIKRTVLEFDPVGVYDTMMNTAGKPVFATDGSIDALGKFQNKIANEIYYAVVGKFTDITSANNKANMAASIDGFVSSMFPAGGELETWTSAEGGKKYSMAVVVDIVKNFDPNSYTKKSDDGKVQQWCFKATMGPEDAGLATDHIRFDSLAEAVNEGWYLRVTIRGQELNYTADQDAIATNTVDATMTIGVTGTFKLNYPTSSWKQEALDATGTVTDNQGNATEKTISIQVKPDTNNKYFEFTPPTGVSNGEEYKLASPLKLELNGCTVLVKTIKISSSATTNATITGDNGYWSVTTNNGTPAATKKDPPSTQSAKDE